jgi:hypothetical protein
MADEKEVVMEVPGSGSGAGKRSRRRRRKTQQGDAEHVSIEKEHSVATAKPTSASVPASGSVSGPAPASASKPVKPVTPAIVVLAPPKKKQAKVLLVPKGKTLRVTHKAFTQKKVRVVIDNTAKTHKRRRQTIKEIDDMPEAELRQAAIRSKLSRPETVAKVPADLLRQMMKDYQMMRGMLL